MRGETEAKDCAQFKIVLIVGIPIFNRDAFFWLTGFLYFCYKVQSTKRIGENCV
jgi:hypothetical protein